MMKKITVHYLEDNIPHTLTVNYGIDEQFKRTQKPHFSVTGEIKVRGRWDRRRWDRCGCIHDDILLHCPELKPLVDLHLSDIDGKPMYSWENGDFLTKEKGFKVGQDYLRLNDQDFKTYLFRLQQVEDAKSYEDEEWEEKAKEKLAQFRAEIEKQWKIEAETAIAEFGLL